VTHSLDQKHRLEGKLSNNNAFEKNFLKSYFLRITLEFTSESGHDNDHEETN